MRPSQARNLDSVGKQAHRLWEHFTVAFVERASNLARDLDVRQLVFADWHDIAFAEQDVARLMHRVGQKQARQLVAGRLHFRLDRRVALQLSFAHERKEREHKLVACRNGGVHVDGRLFRIDARGDVVHDHVVDVILDVRRRIAIRDDLVVGNEHHGVHARILQRYTAFDGTEQVAKMQAARRAVARKHTVVLGVDGQVSADFVAALEACFEAADVGGACHNSPIDAKRRA